MSKNILNTIVALLIGLIAFFGYLNLSIKDELKSKKEQYIKFEKSAKKIYLIKRLKKNKTAILATLSSIKNPTIKDKSTSKIYIYKNLNLRDLHRLLKRIQGTYLPIKKIEIKTDLTNHATLLLEILK